MVTQTPQSCGRFFRITGRNKYVGGPARPNGYAKFAKWLSKVCIHGIVEAQIMNEDQFILSGGVRPVLLKSALDVHVVNPLKRRIRIINFASTVKDCPRVWQ